MSELMKAAFGLIVTAIVLYPVGALTILAGRMFPVEQKSKDRLLLSGRLIGLAGWLITVVVMILNWVEAAAPPFGNMYHVFVVTSFSFLPGYLLLKIYYRVKGGQIIFLLAAWMPLIPALIRMEKVAGWKPPPALQSGYFIPHVLIYMLSYLLLGAAAINGIFQLIQSLITWSTGRQSDKDANHLEKNPQILSSQSVYAIVKCGFFFLSTGLVLGALWAERAWGRYWGWDIKETWALINWVLYLIYFHLRYIKVKREWINAFLVFAFITVLVTLLGVNYMNDEFSSSLHTYSR